MRFLCEIGDLYRYFSKSNLDARRITFYAESAFYYRYFEGYINYILKNSNYDICYVTSDANDPIFKDKKPRIKKFYSNLLFSFIAMFTDARVLIYTMEALGNFHIKRSIKSGAEHIFAFHGPYSTTMVHVKEAFDYYDTIFCIGSYQKEEIRKREQLYSLRSKNLVEIGYPYLDELASEYSRENSIVENNTVLIAPSWHEGNIFETCMIPIVKNLLKAGFKVIARPHDELLKRKPKIIYGIRDYFKSEQSFSVDLDLRNNNSVCSADILITDWSGISFEWALVRERPVLYINTKTKIKNSDYMELGITPIEIQTRNILGKSLDIECLDKIGECAKDLLRNRELYAEEIVKFREKNFYNWKNSAQAGGQYILAALDKDVKLDK